MLWSSLAQLSIRVVFTDLILGIFSPKIYLIHVPIMLQRVICMKQWQYWGIVKCGPIFTWCIYLFQVLQMELLTILISLYQSYPPLLPDTREWVEQAQLLLTTNQVMPKSESSSSSSFPSKRHGSLSLVSQKNNVQLLVTR